MIIIILYNIYNILSNYMQQSIIIDKFYLFIVNPF